MLNIILIAVGGAVGSVLRYGVSIFTYKTFGSNFPYGTLFVNVLGSFIMGLLYVLLIDRWVNFASPLRALLLIGLLGGFTTFSSFSIETLNLFENGELLFGALNILGNVCLCLMFVVLGTFLGRQL